MGDRAWQKESWLEQIRQLRVAHRKRAECRQRGHVWSTQQAQFGDSGRYYGTHRCQSCGAMGWPGSGTS